MKREVITYNQIEGFHRYPDAPEFCNYLEARHRHIFVIRCRFTVTHCNREIEINAMQRAIEGYLYDRFNYPCEFGELSCEHIAEELLSHFAGMVSAEVLEDGYGGASLTR